MPTKTIYVSDEDLPLFEQAQQLAGGNLSSAVAQALARYVSAEAAQRHGYQEVTVRVGPVGSQRQKRFFGVRVMRWQHRSGDGRSLETFSVYRTRGGRYAVHRRTGPNWALFSDPSWWMDVENWRELGRHGRARHHYGRPWQGLDDWWTPGEATLEVYDTLEAMADHVPPELIEALRSQGEDPPLEDLDI
jgi:EXLDI family protein